MQWAVLAIVVLGIVALVTLPLTTPWLCNRGYVTCTR
jgi:hypothetical protein